MPEAKPESKLWWGEALVVEYYDQLTPAEREDWRAGTDGEFSPAFWDEVSRIDRGMKAHVLS